MMLVGQVAEAKKKTPTVQPAPRPTKPEAAGPRPDVLVIITDQWNPRYVSWDNPQVETPNLDRIAGEGMIFDGCYSCSPVCVPSRTSLATGLYVGLAKEYRHEFLRGHPDMRPLDERTKDRPAVGHLKDAVYVYFWGENPAEDLEVATQMKAAGIDRGIAVFYGRHEIDRELCDGIKQLGWVVGRYQMPTGNLFQVSKKHHWPAARSSGNPRELCRRVRFWSSSPSSANRCGSWRSPSCPSCHAAMWRVAASGPTR
jgi:hypothetical protein